MSEKTSTGYRSTGDCSTGYHSTGYCSTGYRSTGDWSISNYSVGHFSTEDYSPYGCFNKPCTKEEWDNSSAPNFIYNLKLTEWVSSSDMTVSEREENKTHIITGGYLKIYKYKEAWLNAWNEKNERDLELLLNLPNFDTEVFKEISGIDVNEDSERNKKIAELEKQAKYIADELNKLK